MRPLDIFAHALFIISILIIAFLPTAFQVSRTPEGTYFPRLHRIYQDYYYDLSVIRQGRTGFEEVDQFTTEQTQSSRVHLFYLLLGRIGQWIHVSDINMYWGSLVVSLVIYYVFSYKLSGIFISDRYRWFGMLIIFFTGPFPKVTFSILGRSISLATSWWTNMDIYSRITLLPHHFIAISLMLAAVYFLFLYKKSYQAWKAVISALILSVSISFFALPGILFLISLAVSAGILILQNLAIHKASVFNLKKLLKFAGFLWFGLPLIAIGMVGHQLTNLGYPWSHFLKWEFDLYNHRPVEIYPYTLPVYLISFGLLPLFAWVPVIRLFRKIRFDHLFFVCMGIVPVILYVVSAKHYLTIPKIRFVYSTPYVFVGLLAAYGCLELTKLFKSKVHRLTVFGFFILVFIVNGSLDLYNYWRPQLDPMNYYINFYIPSDYYQAVQLLTSYTPKGSTIMTNFQIGSFIPVFSHNKVFVGHEVNTLDFWEKWATSNKLYDSRLSASEVRDVFDSYDITYLFWDRGTLSSQYAPLFSHVFSVGGVSVYKRNF